MNFNNFKDKSKFSTLSPQHSQNTAYTLLNQEPFFTVAMQYGSVFWHCPHSSTVSSTGLEQYGHGELGSSSSERWGLRTMASIFFLYFSSICPRVSGRISMAAKLNEEFFRPDLWHSMTVDVKIGTMSRKEKTERIKIIIIFLVSYRKNPNILEKIDMNSIYEPHLKAIKKVNKEIKSI